MGCEFIVSGRCVVFGLCLKINSLYDDNNSLKK